MASAQDTTCAARAGEGPRARPTPSWPGICWSFLRPAVGLPWPAVSRRSLSTTSLMGFLDANEREPGLGGDHDVGHVVVERVPVLDVGR